MHEKGILHEVDCKKRNGTCESSGLLIEVDEEELVDHECDDVEDSSSKIHNRHST